ncbi:DUF6263 family protein [Mucilaginibacter sp.]|uniref:DUF6263 family protein n=1 Tax=Mucilaginibacter sp. TaxID=1882438 RepID=UPI003D14D555
MKYLLNLILLSSICSFCQAQKVKPALNLTKGNTYYMVSTATSSVLQTINGQQNTINVTMAFKMAFKVTDVVDTIYKMEVNYQTLSMKIQAGTATIDMDSKKKDTSDIPSSIIGGMMNQPFNISMSKSGKVYSVENIENMINGVFSKFKGVNTAKKEQIKQQFLSSFGAKAFKGSIEMGTAVFPSKAVAVDDKWIVNTKLDAVIVANVQTTFQLITIVDNSYRIMGDGKVNTDLTAPPATINGMPVKYNINGTVITDIVLDKKTGWITNFKLKQAMQGTVDILDNPSVPGGMSIPMTVNNDQTITDK